VTTRTHSIDVPGAPGVRLAVDETLPDHTSEHATEHVGRNTAVFFPGFGSVRNSDKALRIAAGLRQDGIRVLSFDYEGHGDSTGEFATLTMSRHLRDYRAVRDALIGDADHVLMGSSMGGLVASMAAAEAAAAATSSIRGLVLIAPAFGFRTRFEQKIGVEVLHKWEADGRMAFESEYVNHPLDFELLRDARTIDEHAVIRDIRAPTLLMHGTLDDTVSIEQSVEVRPLFRAPLEFIPIKGGSHRLDEHLDVLATTIRRFISTL